MYTQTNDIFTQQNKHYIDSPSNNRNQKNVNIFTVLPENQTNEWNCHQILLSVPGTERGSLRNSWTRYFINTYYTSFFIGLFIYFIQSLLELMGL